MKADRYHDILRKLEEWDDYLCSESNIPGPRANLELAQAAADLGDRERFEHLLTLDVERTPVNSPDEILAFYGVVEINADFADQQRKISIYQHEQTFQREKEN